MKIKFDKVLLWAVPYLYLISLCYYWGYWGTLDIDAFNYYAVSDIIKGIISPITTSLSYIITLSLMFTWTEIVDSKVKNMSNKVILASGVAGSVLMIGLLFFASKYFIKEHANVYNNNDFLIRIAVTVIYLFLASRLAIKICIYIIDSAGNNNLASGSTFLYLGVYFLLLIPGHTFNSGKENALRILQGKEFQYIVEKEIVTPSRKAYKYLGKIGEYYALIDLDNNKRIIIPVSKLTPLILEKFSSDDSISVQQFKSSQKELTVPPLINTTPRKLDIISPPLQTTRSK